MPEVKTRRYYDFSLMIVTLILCVFGLVVIYSSSAYTAQIKGLASDFYFQKQLKAIALGTAGMIFLSFMDYHLLLKKIPFIKISIAGILYLIALALQVYVLFKGADLNGSSRWIQIPVFGTFQPAELSKLAVIIFTSYMVFLSPKKLNRVSGFIVNLVYISPMLVLIAKENLSTAIIVAGIFVSICFVASRKYWYFILFGVIAVAAVIAYIMLGEGFRMERIEIWQNVESHPKGQQILQGLYAIASGGLFGTGLGQSAQKLGKIPEAFNDMIFTVICEELGLIGAVLLIVLFFILIRRLCFVAMNASDLFGSMLVVGVMAQIAIQSILNIAVVTNSIPSTGVSLPFISYGGTSVLFLMLEIGGAMSVSNHIRYKEPRKRVVYEGEAEPV